MLTLLQGGMVYTPTPIGRADVLVMFDRVAAVAPVLDPTPFERTGLPMQVLDVRDGIVAPGLIDPHEHLLGGSGEEGFSTQTPMITMSELVRAGITTVVGVLGVDTTMKTMAGLLAHVKGLREEGVSAYLWSGGYNVPPASITQSVRNDMLFVEEVIGAGEIAIADSRGLCPSAAELAKVVLDTHVGGQLSAKAGRTHFHVGEHPQRLKRLRELLDGEFAISAEMLYPTHVTRSDALMDEAIDLAQRGSYVDFDVIDGDVARWLSYYLDRGGPPDRLTMSSDAGASSPDHFFEELCRALISRQISLDTLLPFLTSNTADALKLPQKGRLRAGADADVLVLDADSFSIRHVIARGALLLQDGSMVQRESFLSTSNRHLHLDGTKGP